MTINEKINALRQQMAQQQLAGYIVPSSDPHQSEYVASHWKVREWISGFTGSTALVIITPDHAGLWTDSRYFLQAEQELKGSEMVLHKLRVPHTPQHLEWLQDNIPAGSRIGCDGSIFSARQIRLLEKALASKDIELDHSHNLFPAIWKNRPTLPKSKAFELPIELCGESRKEKLRRVQEKTLEAGASDHFISDLADIAWLLNIRASDIDFNPVLIAYLYLSPKQSYLFVEQGKIEAKLGESLRADGIDLKSYGEIKDFLKELDSATSVLVDTASTSIRLMDCLNSKQVVKGSNPCVLMKAIKNKTEAENIREAMVKDGVALTMLYFWLEKELQKRSITEVEVAQYLDNCRRSQGDYQGESFPAIVGYAGNGAIIHYRPTEDKCASLQPEGILLLDSGAQYLQGTTDTTRTTALGLPTEEQKNNFTLVLKGHIGLAQLKFPYGTRGNQMEILARQHLWQQGLNYGHGTGHGVGFFLNVHEGPQSFGGGLSAKTTTVFEPGMLTSNEPGFYKTDDYGIRIENLILCVEDEKTEYGQFLRFDTVTLFPIDLNLIQQSMLSGSERKWLNDYHQRVYEALSPRLSPVEAEWLRKQCKPVG